LLAINNAQKRMCSLVVLVAWLVMPSASLLSVSTAFVLTQGRKSMCAASAFDASGRPFVVMAGGLNSDDSVSSELIVYDALRESKRVLTLSVPRYDCVACRVDDVVYGFFRFLTGARRRVRCMKRG